MCSAFIPLVFFVALALSCTISTVWTGSMMFIPYMKAYWVGASTGALAMASRSRLEMMCERSLSPVSSIVSGREFVVWHGRAGSFGMG